MPKEISIHENQSSIFDLVDDTTTSKVSVMIKSKPPYHKDLFPNVRKLFHLQTDVPWLLIYVENRAIFWILFIVYLPHHLWFIHHQQKMF